MHLEELTEQICRELVVLPSAYGEGGEAAVADALTRWGCTLGWEPVCGSENDLGNGRKNAFLFIPGRTKRTILLIGHSDTVGYRSYAKFFPGREREAATNPDELARIHGSPEGYLPGRGAFDMKAGLAAQLIGGHLAKECDSACSLLFACFADEEGLSLGARHGAAALERFAHVRGLEYIYAINSEIVPEGDSQYPVWFGSEGKVNVLVTLYEPPRHAGYISGFSVRKVLDFFKKIPHPQGYGSSICLYDLVARVMTLTDKASLLSISTGPKDGYTGGGAIHVLFSLPYRSGECDKRLMDFRKALASACEYRAEFYFCGPDDVKKNHLAVPEAKVPYVHGVANAVEAWLQSRSGNATVAMTLLDPWYPAAPFPAELKKRLSGRISEISGKLGIAAKPEGEFPFISDASFLWGSPDEQEREMSATIVPDPELDGIRMIPLGVPVVNLGPLGADAHLATERVKKDFAFSVLPKLIGAVAGREC
ncbi:MAG: M20/M25/M40 family metallo-hydrolase [Candidatus Brocadiia bacterium]